MDANPFPIRHLTQALLIGLGTLLGLFIVLHSEQPAHAASETSCGQAVCFVESTVRGESNWADEPYTSATGETYTPGVSSGNATPKSMTTYVGCSSWHDEFSGSLIFDYPYEDSGLYRCWFPDRTMATSDTCPSVSDRASNGRVDYYIERVKPDGSTAWFYARFRCLYPNDAHAPIARLTGSGKIYTGGQASFFQTSTASNAAVNTTYQGGGTLSNTTGYVNRNVDLTNPERYIGDWQPSFTAQTLTRNGQPVYGYYRLDWMLDYRLCERWEYPAWLNAPNTYDCSQSGTDTTTNPYTYACNFTPPLTAGIRDDGLFVPSLCNPQWTCTINGDYTVGGEPHRVTVLRNGVNVPVTFPQPSATGTGLRNVRAWQTSHTITPGATPSADYLKTSWRWDTWANYTPTGTIAFNWVSEDPTRPFSWTSHYRFTADYLLPVQHGSTWQMEWVIGSATCPQTTSSTQVDVVRSVNR